MPFYKPNHAPLWLEMENHSKKGAWLADRILYDIYIFLIVNRFLSTGIKKDNGHILHSVYIDHVTSRTRFEYLVNICLKQKPGKLYKITKIEKKSANSRIF